MALYPKGSLCSPPLQVYPGQSIVPATFCPRSAAGADWGHFLSHPTMSDPQPWLVGGSASVTQGSQGHCCRLCPKSRRQESVNGKRFVCSLGKSWGELKSLLLSAVVEF